MFRECDAKTLLEQIGLANLRAISGGRFIVRGTGVTLPCGNGYSVTVDLAGNDTYTCRLVFTRAGVERIKSERTDVYCDQIGETAYRAGMFRDQWNEGTS
jgi:hypothetical protein